jgi:glycosyltransferase involved in cell wall biosynthesis
MKIVYVITRTDSVGGASIHVRDLASAMIRRGAAVTVLVGDEGPVTEQLAAAGVPFRSLRFLRRSLNPWNDLRALVEVVSVLKDLRPDLVSAHTAKAGWIGRAAARRLGIPAVYTPHGWSIGARTSPVWGALFTVAEKAAAGWCRKIIGVCEQERNLALARSIAPASKLVVVHNGVRDVEPALLARPERNPARLCSIARFAAPKDHCTLFSALAMMRSEDWELDLVGDGPLIAERQRQARMLGLDDRIHFHGYLPDPAPVLSRAQVFVLSSRSEALPRSVLEALRAGLPVVASDVGGMAECVSHGVNGFLTPARDAAAFAAALRRLCASPALRRQMGGSARESYERRFRLDCMVDRTFEIYAELVEVERPLKYGHS